MTDYSCIEVIYKISSSGQPIKTTGKIPLIENCSLVMSYSDDYIYNRVITSMSENWINFGDCYYKSSLGNSGSTQTQNMVCIPIRVVLYK